MGVILGLSHWGGGHILMVFENRVLRRILGHKEGGSARKLEKTA
jgi:hypothetical protein